MGTWYNMDEFQNNCAQWKKLTTKSFKKGKKEVPENSIFVKHSEKANQQKQSRLVVTLGYEEKVSAKQS